MSIPQGRKQAEPPDAREPRMESFNGVGGKERESEDGVKPARAGCPAFEQRGDFVRAFFPGQAISNEEYPTLFPWHVACFPLFHVLCPW